MGLGVSYVNQRSWFLCYAAIKCTEMNRTATRLLWILSGISALAVDVSLGYRADATEYVRSTATDVILPDWAGRWNCNVNVRQPLLRLELEQERKCSGGFCTQIVTTTVWDRFRSNGGPWASAERKKLDSNNLPTSWRDRLNQTQPLSIREEALNSTKFDALNGILQANKWVINKNGEVVLNAVQLEKEAGYSCSD